MADRSAFMPVSLEDMKHRGIEQLDFVYILGDAYVDHPSFGAAIISRILEKNGYSVGIISQPNYKDSNSVLALGMPRLGFLVSSGNMDSMVNHYYVSKKRRTQDAYTPGGKIGARPDRAVIVYCNLIRQNCKKTPIIVGGVEASLRRLAHYDYWSDSFRRSILLESGADIVSYGMGERSIIEIADALNAGVNIKDINYIRGTVYKTSVVPDIPGVEILASYDDMIKDKRKYAESFLLQSQNMDAITANTLVEPYSSHCFIIQNPPSFPLTMQEMDDVYALNYTKEVHPDHIRDGGVSASEEIKFSLSSNRGCFGACNFCALAFHQGRTVQVRSHESLIEEAVEMTKMKDFKGYIHDVGGPTANFRHRACEKQLKNGVCKNRQCLFPSPCPNLNADHSDYVALLRKLRNIPKVKKVFVRSGIRFDYCLADSNKTFLKEMVEHHISGQLKVAPEHVSDAVLSRMGKPKSEVYRRFVKEYEKLNLSMGKKQFLVPYFMSSHPGSTMKDAVKLAEYIRDTGYMPEQVQDFYPTPSTMSTVMYYTGIDPLTKENVYIVKNPHEKAMQRALIQYSKPENYDLVKEALILANRKDLIGFDEKCLIRPRKLLKEKKNNSSLNSTKNIGSKQNHKNISNKNIRTRGKADGKKRKR